MAKVGAQHFKELFANMDDLELYPKTAQVLEKLDAALERLEMSLEQRNLDAVHNGIVSAREARDSLRQILGEEEPRLKKLESSLQVCRAAVEGGEYPDVDPDA